MTYLLVRCYNQTYRKGWRRWGKFFKLSQFYPSLKYSYLQSSYRSIIYFLLWTGPSRTINCFFCIVAFDIWCLSLSPLSLFLKMMAIHFQTPHFPYLYCFLLSAFFEGTLIHPVNSQLWVCHYDYLKWLLPSIGYLSATH